MTVKKCFGRRPDGTRCTNTVALSATFCPRCNGEVFKVKFKFDEPDEDKPNTYEPEPVEVPFNDREEVDPLA